MSVIDDKVAWNNEMYHRHATPYGWGIAGWISGARVDQVKSFAQVRPADAVLELGCERGSLLLSLPPCRRLVGSDISSAALADAAATAEKHGRKQAEFVQHDAEELLPFAVGEFDVIIASEMLEHVPHPRRVLENMAAIATTDTRVVISVPIEKPKLLVKSILRKTGLLGLLFPGIEAGQSEWHLHQFDKRMIRDCTAGLFAIESMKNIWSCHYVALLRKAP